MTEKDILKRVAPCGLNCGACLAFEGGPIQRSSRELTELLGPNFIHYSKRLSAMNPVLGKYPDFAEVLHFLAGGTCGGCRATGCLYSDCRVRLCVRERGVDFCHQCPDFPCSGTGYPPELLERWRDNNEKLRGMGLAAYHEMIRSKPRYP